MLQKNVTLLRLAARSLTTVSPRLGLVALRRLLLPGLAAMSAFRRRTAAGELFPPFLFFALTDACNLTCRGCWVNAKKNRDALSLADVSAAILAGKKKKVRFITLLGGEPFLWPELFRLIENFRDCYFQIITNGQTLSDEVAETIRRLGNVTPLVSIDGFEATNDQRRGIGTFLRAMDGCRRLAVKKIPFGVATVVTADNFAEVLSENYVESMIKVGAIYLWYYVYRPVGADPAPELALDAGQIHEFRRRLLDLRQRCPIILIDTYWDADGKPVCPAARGMGFHFGPDGGIQPCPPLSVFREKITDHNGDLATTFAKSEFLPRFQKFVTDRTSGCVILEKPDELADFFAGEKVFQSGAGDLIAELKNATPSASHGACDDLPENFWFYRFLKKRLFFGMGGYG